MKEELDHKGENPNRYWIGQVVECSVVSDQPGGYAVSVGAHKQAGFLQTERMHDAGATVLAQLVGSRDGVPVLQELSQSRSGYARLRDSFNHESTLWQLKFKRATDLMVASQSGPPKEYNSSSSDVKELFEKLSDRLFTGCIKSFSQSATSRSAALIHLGRVVGCIYSNKVLTEVQSPERSLELLLADAPLPDTQIYVYELPEEIVIPLSALFLGCPVDRSDELQPVEYVEYMAHWLKKNRQTACFAISSPQSTWLTLIYQGDFSGTFQVEEQKFNTDVPYIFNELRANPRSFVEMALLPPDQALPGADFGYALA